MTDNTMEDFAIPEGVRDRLDLVGETIIYAISPDKVDGLSDLELGLLKAHGTSFFKMMEGRGLPSGFAKHFHNDVLVDIEKVRRDEVARAAVRERIRGIISDPKELDSLYRPGGTTYSEILHDAARHAETGMFRTPAQPGEFQRANRAGRNRRM